ncbi:HK97 family phage prohead protease [Paenibacillus alkalitolerans]|uniref:HK97 family phage prohead protease n=1 Tax=Paenibacillus alkalitolerans TaxID=2799335 RepID=UPI0018F79153|nr:HK97 family phage prohead protease [Paenibacillus alkalitolerans]
MSKKTDTIKRYFEVQEFRAVEPTESSGAAIEGYAIIYESKADIGGWFEETIKRGALDGADLRDVPFFVQHNTLQIPLARSRNNNANSTLQLRVDDKGLYFRAELDVEKNPDAAALHSAVSRGDLDAMSFSFSVKDQVWRDQDTDYPKRDILKFSKIHEISAVHSPAYLATSIQARSEALDSADQAALESARRSAGLDSSKNEQQELEILKFKAQILSK